MAESDVASLLGAPAKSNRPGDTPVEHLDYEYVKTCTSSQELEKILSVLRSGREGSYPDLERFTESRCVRLDLCDILLDLDRKKTAALINLHHN